MDAKKVKQIVEDEQEKVCGVRPLSGGATHHMFEVELEGGNSLVFQGVNNRWHDFPSFEIGYRAEPMLLDFLEKKDYRSPSLIQYDFSRDDFDYRYILMENLDGRDMNRISDEEVFLDLVEQSGNLMSRLQSLKDFEKSGKLYIEDGELSVRGFDWKEMYKSLVHTYTTRMIDRRYDHLRTDIESLVEDYQDCHHCDKFTLVHQEFGPRNILAQDREIKGIVDWERTISGDSEYEFISTRERMLQKANRLNIEHAKRKVEDALEAGYGRKIYSEIDPQKDNLYRLAFLAQLMWVARNEDPEKLKLEEKLNKIEEELRS